MLILAVTLAPIVAVGLYFYCRDKYEKEPLSLLLTAFLGGVCVIPLAIILELFVQIFIVNPASSPVLRSFLRAFILAGLVEESCKLLVFILLIYRRKEFNEPYDGILYMVMIALGFAFLENVLFVARHEAEVMIYASGTVRAFAAVFGHVLFGLIMGYYLSKAKFAGAEGEKNGYFMKGLAIPVLLHGLYNFAVYFYTALGVALVLIGFYYSWRFGFRAMAEAQDSSPFKKQKAA